MRNRLIRMRGIDAEIAVLVGQHRVERLVGRPGRRVQHAVRFGHNLSGLGRCDVALGNWSNFDTHIAAVSERHIASPKTTEIMAETHGMLDTPAGPPDKALYTMLTDKDGDFGVDPAHPDKPVPHPEAQLRLPYLPDPFAPGAAFRTL